MRGSRRETRRGSPGGLGTGCRLDRSDLYCPGEWGRCLLNILTIFISLNQFR